MKTKFNPQRFLMPKMSDEGAEGGSSSSVSETIPAISSETHGSTSTPSVDFGAIIPGEYKEKPYMQDLLKASDPQVEFFKQFDNLQGKLGQRPAGIPQKDAPQEEWNSFYDTLGRPESAEKYDFNFPEIEGATDEETAEFKTHLSDEVASAVKDSFYKHGIPAETADALYKEYVTLLFNKTKGEWSAESVNAKEQDELFDKTGTQLYGDKWDNVLEKGNTLISKHVPQELKDVIQTFDGKQTAVLASALYSVSKEYISEDSIAGGQKVVRTKEDKMIRANELYNHEAFDDAGHPMHKQIANQLAELFGNDPIYKT